MVQLILFILKNCFFYPYSEALMQAALGGRNNVHLMRTLCALTKDFDNLVDEIDNNLFFKFAHQFLLTRLSEERRD